MYLEQLRAGNDSSEFGMGSFEHILPGEVEHVRMYDAAIT